MAHAPARRTLPANSAELNVNWKCAGGEVKVLFRLFCLQLDHTQQLELLAPKAALVVYFDPLKCLIVNDRERFDLVAIATGKVRK
jgi:hypothetical protein